MKIAYRLKDDAKHIAQVQKATLTTDNFGIEPTHGLFGSPEWWDRVTGGDLSVHTLRGIVTERFMGSMGDWPMIKVRNDAGEESQWTREVNTREQDALYRVGRRIEIDYVLQRHRRKSSDPKAEHKVVIEIRVGPGAPEDSSGSYEKLRAAEIARGVLTQPFWTVMEVSHELAELGKTPGVMPGDVHKVFMEASSDMDRVISEVPKAPDMPHELDRVTRELHERWKDAVFSACKKLLSEP